MDAWLEGSWSGWVGVGVGDGGMDVGVGGVLCEVWVGGWGGSVLGWWVWDGRVGRCVSGWWWGGWGCGGGNRWGSGYEVALWGWVGWCWEYHWSYF